MDPRNLYDLFIKFGVVKDVFIPKKRRKSTNSRFGFVQYDYSTTARIVEHKANGLWVDDKSLAVKFAKYGNGSEERRKLNPIPTRQPKVSKTSTMANKRKWNQGTDGRSFAEVIKGTESRCTPKTTIKVEEVGNGWLYESLIMRLKMDYSVLSLCSKIGFMTGVSTSLSGDLVCTFNKKESIPQEFMKIRVLWMQLPLAKELQSMRQKKMVAPKLIGDSNPLKLTSWRKKKDDKADKVIGEYDVANVDTVFRLKKRVELAISGSWSHVSAVEETKNCEGKFK
ncbi:hypothetical protein ACSBR1_033122 [Camellia fascicularis]